MSPLDCDTAFTNCFFMSLQEDSGTQFPVKFRVLTYEITKDCLLCVAFVSTGQSAEEISKESFDSPQLKKKKQKKTTHLTKKIKDPGLGTRAEKGSRLKSPKDWSGLHPHAGLNKGHYSCLTQEEVGRGTRTAR